MIITTLFAVIIYVWIVYVVIKAISESDKKESEPTDNNLFKCTECNTTKIRVRDERAGTMCPNSNCSKFLKR